jgi:hypothetical protein
MGDLTFLRETFSRVGWFIPPYIRLGALGRVAKDIHDRGDQFGPDDLESALTLIYDAGGMAAMVSERYPLTPCIRDYQVTIGEAVEAHFLGLDHVAVSGLIPVIEGAGRQLAQARGLGASTIKDVFKTLAADCKQEAISKQLGDIEEVASMMDSFSSFTTDYLYVNSSSYPGADGTNRHGILHGAYADTHYGRPLNFFKTVAAVDFLTFVSSFRAHLSWLAPDTTTRSTQLAQYYLMLMRLKRVRPRGEAG